MTTAHRLIGLAIGATCSLAPLAAHADDSCAAIPDPTTTAGSAADVHARAKSAFDAKRYVEAAGLFRAVATDHATDSLGLPSAQLSLESLRLAGVADTTCFDAMARDVPTYSKLYCGGSANGDACRVFQKIQVDLRRLSAEKKVELADKSRPNFARALFKEAAGEFLDIWKTYAMPACRHGGGPDCVRSEELLFNAARAYRAAHDISAAIVVQEMLLDPANGLSQTALASRTGIELAEEYVALGDYAHAAPMLERAVALAPKESSAVDGIENAIMIRLALDDEASAAKDLDTMTKNYGAKEAARVGYATTTFARVLEERHAWPELEKFIESHQAILGTAKGLEGFFGKAMLGRALAMQGKTKQADEALKSIAAAHLGDLVESRSSDAADSVLQMRDTGRVLNAIGDATLYFANKLQADALKLEVKKQNPDSLAKKKAAIDKAKRAYGAILDLQPMPPPRAVVAAAGRVARMDAQLWGQVYVALGPDAAAPYEHEALGSHRSCVSFASKFQYGTDDAQACGAWIDRHEEHAHPLTELLPTPHWAGGDTMSSPAPLAQDGDEVEKVPEP